MLHHRQLLLLLRAQQSASRKRVRYLMDSKPVYYSEEIEELIDRFDLELPQTEDFFINTPVKAFREPLEPSKELTPNQTTKVLHKSLLGVIKELTEALAVVSQDSLAKKTQENKVKAIKNIIEIVEKTKKKVKKEEEMLFILMEM
jgi:hypothetical protein